MNPIGKIYRYIKNRKTTNQKDKNKKHQTKNTKQKNTTDIENHRQTIGGSSGFVVDEVKCEKKFGKKIISYGYREDTDKEVVFAGGWGRSAIESSRFSGEPTWIGVGTRHGRPAGIEENHLFRHQAIFGRTGYGKSTLLKNMFLQWVIGGHGGCFIDPKGDDSLDLLEIIPKDRTDDIVWIEPGTSEDYVTGFNFLEVSQNQEDPYFDVEVENIVEDLVGMFSVGNSWGARMDRITKNMVRAMNHSNYEFTLLDMYFILQKEKTRKRFAEFAEKHDIKFIKEYTRQIADILDQKDLEPLLGRMQDWVENPTARRLISFRGSNIDIRNLIDNNKILIVRMSREGEDLKKRISLAVIRKIWSAIKSRSKKHQKNTNPFFLVIDEFDNIVEKNNNLTTIFSEARSRKLSLTVCCQYPSMLSNKTLKDVYANTDTIISFNPGLLEDARDIAKQLGDIKPDTLLGESNYHVWMEITLPNNEKSETFRVYTIPPYPPIRTKNQARKLKIQSLKKYGRKKRTEKQIENQLMINQIKNSVDIEKQHIKAYKTAKIRHKTQKIPVEKLNKELKRHIEDPPKKHILANIREKSKLFKTEQKQNKIYVSLTEKGKKQIQQDTGKNIQSGHDKHRHLIKKTQKQLIKLGGIVEIKNQQKQKNQPDGILKTPKNQKTPKPIKTILGDNKKATVEIETSTYKKPVKILKNIEKAQKKETKCIFCIPEKTNKKQLPKRIIDILQNPTNKETQKYKIFYNTKNPVNTEENKPVVIKNTRQKQWKQNKKTKEITLETKKGENIARFKNKSEITNPKKYPGYIKTDTENKLVVYRNNKQNLKYKSKKEFKKEWNKIYKPYIPTENLKHKIKKKDYEILIIPKNDKPPYIYKKDKLLPLNKNIEYKNKTQNNKNQEKNTKDKIFFS